jgi:DMSO/TMAO reductase YedYZ molybdopterin-dependent catalytic subunit
MALSSGLPMSSRKPPHNIELNLAKRVYCVELPVHRLLTERDLNGAILQVDGLVGECLQLTPAALQGLPQRDFTSDFICLEGWTVPDVKWGGVLLEAVLSLAKPAAQARYIQASAREFSIPLPMDRVEQVLIATRLDNRALTAEQGGPFRLVVPDGDCFMQIKWLDHLELREEPGDNTAERIALGRLAAHNAPAQTARGG